MRRPSLSQMLAAIGFATLSGACLYRYLKLSHVNRDLIATAEEGDLLAEAEPVIHPESIRATCAVEVDEEAAYQRYLDRLKAYGIPESGAW